MHTHFNAYGQGNRSSVFRGQSDDTAYIVRACREVVQHGLAISSRVQLQCLAMAESAVGDLSDLKSTLSEAPKHFLWEVCASARAAALVFVWAATTRQNGTRARDAATAGSHDSSGQHEKDGVVVDGAGRGVMPSLPPEIVRFILEMYPKKAMICNATLRFATPAAPLMACSRCRGVWCVRRCMHTLHTRSSATGDHACGYAYISHGALTMS
jgi:hypothetical protein